MPTTIQPNTSGKKKSKPEKPKMPNKNGKMQQENKARDNEMEEKDLGLLKRKQKRPETPSSVTTDSETVNEDMENVELENDSMEMNAPGVTTPITPVPISTVTSTTAPPSTITRNGCQASYQTGNGRVVGTKISSLPIISSAKL